MPSFSQMTQVNSIDPFDGGLGARKPRPDEIAKREAEMAAKEAAEQRAYSFEKIVHATEKQMRQEAVGEAAGRANGSAPLGKASNPPSKLDAHGYFTHNYLMHAAAAEKMSQEIENWWKTTSLTEITGAVWPKFSGLAPRIWPNDFKREIEDLGCDLLGVFNDHFGLAVRAESIASLARISKMPARDYLTSMTYDKTEDDKVWFNLPSGRRVFLRKQNTHLYGTSFNPER